MYLFAVMQRDISGSGCVLAIGSKARANKSEHIGKPNLIKVGLERIVKRSK
jgi:hypothetical protein